MEAANSFTRRTIEDDPIVSPENCNRSSSEASIVSPEAREGNPLKGIQERISNEGRPPGDFFPSLPEKSKSENPLKTDSLAKTIWSMTPPMGRERSSMKQLEDALKKIPLASKPMPETLLAALEAWNKSETWTKDGGLFVGGIHIWVKNQKWKNPPAPSAPKANGYGSKTGKMSLEEAAKLLGGRAAHLETIPNRPSTPETIER